MNTIDWPYIEDGVKRDPFAESLRIPIIDTPFPRWAYVTAVMVGKYPWEKLAVRPTDAELRIVVSFHQEYVDYWYRGYYAEKLTERPFDIDGGANGRILVKYVNGGWGYRRRSWERGPMFFPQWDSKPRDLVSVLDHAHGAAFEVSARWTQWKQDHPDVFGGAS